MRWILALVLFSVAHLLANVAQTCVWESPSTARCWVTQLSEDYLMNEVLLTCIFACCIVCYVISTLILLSYT
jgi:hypothetical protein